MESLDIDPLAVHLQILLSSPFVGFTAAVFVGILVILLLLILSALISGSEIAFFSLSPNQIHELRTKDVKANHKIIQLLEKPKRLLATILISNNFINISIVIISTYVVNSLFNFEHVAYWLAFLIQVVIVTSLILLLGEIIPKIYATKHNILFATFMVSPLKFLIRIFYPLSSLLVRSTDVIDRRISKKAYNISMSELSDAIELTSNEDTPEEEKKILQGIVRFGDIEVKEIMKSRMDVTAVDIHMNFVEMLNYIIESGYSRVPAYEESFDHVKGILYIKDLLPHLSQGDDFSWQNLLRDALFIPENKKINDLLQEFQDKKIHMAIVVDEYGGTSGLVTLEDIIEEIVGEISDEHDLDMEDVIYSQLDDLNYIFEGKTSLNDMCKILGIDDDIFDAIKGDADSLAGVVLELMKKMPEKDEKASYRQYTFTVKAVDKRRIKRVQLTLDPDWHEEKLRE